MIRRYEVMWKHDGQVHELAFQDGRFFTKKNAFKRMYNLNIMGFHSKARSVAVVWDHKLNKQISTGLYSKS